MHYFVPASRDHDIWLLIIKFNGEHSISVAESISSSLFESLLEHFRCFIINPNGWVFSTDCEHISSSIVIYTIQWLASTEGMQYLAYF